MENRFTAQLTIALISMLVFLASACARKPEAEKCDDPPTRAGVETSPAAAPSKKPEPVKMEAKDVMWCRSCVVGPAGYMSCQTVRQETTSETTDALRERARLAGCKDAGFPEGTCPGSGVISLVCKGDPPPADNTAAGKAMLNALKKSGPLVLTKDGKTVQNIMHEDPAGPGKPGSEDDAKKSAGPEKSSASTHVE